MVAGKGGLHEVGVVDGVVLKIAASIGISIYPDDGLDLDGLIRAADKAMYAAKNQPNGQVYHMDKAVDWQI